MPSTKTNSKSAKRENPRGGTRARVAIPPKRAPRTREDALAQSANTLGLTKSNVSFGAPVSSSQIAMYEKALKSLRKSKTIAQFLGFDSAAKALRQLRPVATGATKSSALSPKTRDAFAKLRVKLDALHAAEGKVNKTWPRKHAIVICALLAEKPAPKPRAKKSPAAATETVAATSTEPTPSVS